MCGVYYDWGFAVFFLLQDDKGEWKSLDVDLCKSYIRCRCFWRCILNLKTGRPFKHLNKDVTWLLQNRGEIELFLLAIYYSSSTIR